MKKQELPVYLLLGGLFGFILSRSGATSFEQLHKMFLFQSFQLYGIIGSAIPVTALGFMLIKRWKRKKKLTRPVHFPKRRLNPGTIPGSILFGLGWGIAGTCPAPAIIQVGEGHLYAIATVIGILLGNWLFKVVHRKYFTWKPEVCG